MNGFQTARLRSIPDGRKVLLVPLHSSDLTEIAEATPLLFADLSCDRLDDNGQRIVDRVESADALVEGSVEF